MAPDSDVVGSTMTRKLTLFSHIPKSAGTFLNNVATVNYDAAITFSKKSRPFCLFDSSQTDFTSAKAPNCRRDLVAELAEQCQRKGL